EKLNIPYSNLSEWSKKSDDNWRKRIYILLSNIDEKEVVIFRAIPGIFDMKNYPEKFICQTLYKFIGREFCIMTFIGPK
ncbi:MAG: hypothetical protein U9N85_07330, partial [Bacteroidota bacterium]|nr:hypothetical protein [Bacteroidota bacterium]